MTFQSGRLARMSDPMIPRSGMKGMPFSAACSIEWIAGQVASRTTTLPAFSAAVKRGAKPASPSETAEVSISATQPAPTRMSVAKPETGTPSRRRLRAPLRISALASATDGSELSGGIATSAPSGTWAASASTDGSIIGAVPPAGDATGWLAGVTRTAGLAGLTPPW
jgi:hypothetical protein